MKSSVIAPRTGPGYSSGKKPNSTGASPKASAGNKTGTNRSGDPKATTSSGSKSGHAAMRKPY